MRDVPAIPFDLTKNLIGSLNRTRFPLASLSPVLPATGSRPHRLPPLTGCVTNRIRPVIHSLPTDRRARKTESPCNPARCHEPVGRANRPKPVTPPSTGAHFGPPRALPPPSHFHWDHFCWPHFRPVQCRGWFIRRPAVTTPLIPLFYHPTRTWALPGHPRFPVPMFNSDVDLTMRFL